MSRRARRFLWNFRFGFLWDDCLRVEWHPYRMEGFMFAIITPVFGYSYQWRYFCPSRYALESNERIGIIPKWKVKTGGPLYVFNWHRQREYIPVND